MHIYIGPVQVWLQNMIHDVHIYGPACLAFMYSIDVSCMHVDICHAGSIRWICTYRIKCFYNLQRIVCNHQNCM